MSNQTVEELWRALGNDGLAKLFETGSGSGVLADLMSALGHSNGKPSSAGLASESPMTALAGQGFLTDFLGALPLAGGFLKTLIGGKPESTTPPAVRYSLPGSIRLDTSLGEDPLTESTMNWGGQLGEVKRQMNPTVVINVNALDSRSILDRSDDIANAVRQAMLTYQPFDDIWR